MADGLFPKPSKGINGKGITRKIRQKIRGHG
jgi:hypothetical protein